jgi:oxygen-independent coproporphyrinogen-3 oxidase
MQEVDPSEWLRALDWEMDRVHEEGVFILDDSLDTLFVGGGTPSTLGPSAMSGLSAILGPGRLRDPGLEWTVEANPESFSPSVAEGWADAGVNRISLGVQSFQAGPLSWLHRLHGPEEARRAISAARDAGIENLNVDLIFGLPPQVGRDWEADLIQLLELDLPHLSLYGLSVERGTPLSKAVEEGKISHPREEDYRRQFLEAHRMLSEAGYSHYEVSNFAKPGFESRHNRVYWEGGPYLGLGASAHSFRPPLRRWNVRSWDAYLKSCLQGVPPWEGQETLGSHESGLEKLWLGLRTDRGVPLQDLSPESGRLVDLWVSEGYARTEGGRVRLNPEGWLLLDELVIELDRTQGGKAPMG